MLDEIKKKMLALYDKGINLYFSRKFEEAAEYFKQACDINPDDWPSKLQYLRCLEYIKDPPPENWDGSFTMKSK